MGWGLMTSLWHAVPATPHVKIHRARLFVFPSSLKLILLLQSEANVARLHFVYVLLNIRPNVKESENFVVCVLAEYRVQVLFSREPANKSRLR